MNAPTLLPCPFCGAAAEIVQRGTACQRMIVACSKCGAKIESGDVVGLSPPDELRWNRRREPAELARLRADHAALVEDRARFPDRPDGVGRMIGAHIGNLKAGAAGHEAAWRVLQARNDALRAELDRLRAALRDLVAEIDAPGDGGGHFDASTVKRARAALEGSA